MFYIIKTAENGWSKTALKAQIESGLHLRQGKAITNFQNTLPKAQSDLAQETIKNPYVSEFVGFSEEMKERDIERAFVAHIKKFMLELGKGFAYVGNQFNIPVEEDDYFLDLLFYNYHLRCFVVFELKVGDLKPEYAGKLNFYINTVNEQIKGVEDKPTIGILLCKTPNKSVVKYSLQGIKTPMGISEYQFTRALPKELKSGLPTIEAFEQELDKDILIRQSPLREKLSALKEMMAKRTGEEVQKQKSPDDVIYIFNDLLSRIQRSIEKNLSEIEKESSNVKISRLINNTSSPYFALADLEKHLQKDTVHTLGLNLRMEGLGKGGTKAFDVLKDLFVILSTYKYSLGPEKQKPWIEKLYHQHCTDEEIDAITERWCKEVIDEIHNRLLNIQAS